MGGLSYTVLTKGNSPEVHHPLGRRNTVRELATLQTFPHHFEFLGDYAEQCRQIGNDVPPLFAESLFSHLLQQVRGFDNEEIHGSNGHGGDDTTLAA
jgi:site-specific DNA-cytosine methylase